MLIIAHFHDQAMSSKAKADNKYKTAQLIKMRAIVQYKEAGEALKAIRDLLKPATKTNPIETDLGVFTGWEDYLRQNKWSKGSVHDYIFLAEHWDVVIKLGMQDTSSNESVKKCMRLCRTVKIIKWYLAGIASGRPEEELTIEQYWLEQEQPIQKGLSKRQLELELERALSTIEQLKLENSKLKAKLSNPAVPYP